MTSWEIGRKLDQGKYIVEQELGRGAFGVTYRVRETRTDRLFAVKTLNESLQQRTDFPAIQVKFINEAIRLAKCSHPNIADVTEVFMEDQLWCMVMEYIDGIELASYLRQQETLSETEAINIIDRVGLALSCVHEKNILHRDIKPENILLRKSDLSPVLVDFGLARELVPNLTLQSMSHFGTLFYAPIEEYEQKGNFGAWTDIYALAATLYVLLVGREKIPAQLSTVRKIEYLANKKDPLPTPKQINSDISDRINEAILKGMAIEPGDRPKIVQDWLKLLKSKLIDLKDVINNNTIFFMGFYASGKSCYFAALAYYLKELENEGVIEKASWFPKDLCLLTRAEILKQGTTLEMSSSPDDIILVIKKKRSRFFNFSKKNIQLKNDINVKIFDAPASVFCTFLDSAFDSAKTSIMFDKISHYLNHSNSKVNFFNYYEEIVVDEFLYTNRIALMINSSTLHRDLEYCQAIENVYMNLENIFSTDLKKSYRIAVIFSSFDLPGIYEYRHKLNDFIQLYFSQTNQSLNQWKNKWNCSLEYFCCSAYGMINNTSVSNSNWKSKFPDYSGSHNYAYSELAEPKNWKPFGLLEPIVWLLNK